MAIEVTNNSTNACPFSSHLFLQVYSVVDEMFLAGEIRETSQTKVLKQLLMLSSLEWSAYSIPMNCHHQ